MVQIGLWLLLVMVLAGPIVVLLALPVAAGLWLWERGRGNGFAPWSWLTHLCEMTVAMYAGMFVYMAFVRPVVSSVLGDNLFGGAPSYLGMLLAMLLPMVALMRLEGHSSRMTGEMTLAMVAPIVACFGFVGLGICPLVPFLAWLTPTSVYGAAHDGMLLGMVVVMVVRRGMYSEIAPMTPPVGIPTTTRS